MDALKDLDAGDKGILFGDEGLSCSNENQRGGCFQIQLRDGFNGDLAFAFVEALLDGDRAVSANATTLFVKDGSSAAISVAVQGKAGAVVDGCRGVIIARLRIGAAVT